MIIERLEPRRMLSAGQLDASFGNHGRVLTHFANAEAVIQQLVPMLDGRVLAAGYAKLADGTSAVALARYFADGTADPSFGDHGMEIANIPSAGDTILNAVAVSHRGDIYVATSFANVTRFASDGTLDTSFGNAGTIFSTIDVDTIAAANDGGVILGGQAVATDSSGEAVGAVERFKFNGHHDLHFGQKGVYRFPSSVADDYTADVQKLKVESDNSVRVIQLSEWNYIDPGDDQLGIPPTTQRAYGGDYFLLPGEAATGSAVQINMRDIRDWTIDAFDIDPEENITVLDDVGEIQRTTAVGERDLAYFDRYQPSQDDIRLFSVSWIIAQSKGKLIVGGQLGSQISRFNHDGSTDASFGDGGSLNLSFSVLNSVTAVQSQDGSIWLAGGHKGDFALVRVWNDDAPTATARYAERTSSSATTQKIFVTYRDDDGVYARSIDRNDIRVYLPDGTSRPVSLFATEPDGSSILATYAFAAPGGSWDPSDNGLYIVRVKGKQVSDLDGNAMEGRAIGAFVVRVS